MRDDLELTILMPCLDEAETIGRCVAKARTFLTRSHISGEILVADNGSTDGSRQLAEANGACVVNIRERGYGSALIGGIRAARGTYVIMGDSDDSYDFATLEPFVEKLRQGYELVMGNRFQGVIRPGAMPLLHRYVGNPVLSAIGRIFFHAPCGDFHCGLRGFHRRSVLDLDLQAPGMEFASEMVVKATINNLRIAEVPISLSPDGRNRAPHLRSWRDGWRHLRFLLLFCPRWLFLYPGLALFAIGLLTMGWLLPGPQRLDGVALDIHTLFYASLSIVVGYQAVLFWVFAKLHGVREGIMPPDLWFRAVIGIARLEVGLILGAMLFIAGLALAGRAVGLWGAGHFGELSPSEAMRFVIPSGTAILLGCQTAYSAFFMSVLELRATRISEATPQEQSADAA